MRRSKTAFLVVLVGCLALSVLQADGAAAARRKCAKYVPGGNGAGLPVKVIKDSAKATAPMTFTMETAPGAGTSSFTEGGETGNVSHVYANFQMDSKTATRKLWVRVEFSDATDYDIFLRDKYGASSYGAAGFNQVIVHDPEGSPQPIGLDGTGFGGHSEVGAEQLDGIATLDCTGYTLDIVSASTPGGTVTVKYWLSK